MEAEGKKNLPHFVKTTVGVGFYREKLNIDSVGYIQSVYSGALKSLSKCIWFKFAKFQIVIMLECLLWICVYIQNELIANSQLNKTKRTGRV